MSSNAQLITEMYEQLSEKEQLLIAELICRLLPDDVATPHDLAVIAKTQAEYERGEIVSEKDICWD